MLGREQQQEHEKDEKHQHSFFPQKMAGEAGAPTSIDEEPRWTQTHNLIDFEYSAKI